MADVVDRIGGRGARRTVACCRAAGATGSGQWTRIGTAVALIGVAACLACGARDASPASPSASPAAGGSSSALEFTAAPIDPDALQFVVALGNTNPWAHTLPSDHIYFYHHLDAGAFPPVPVVVPAAGTVENVLDRGADSKVWVRVNGTYTYYLDHITLASSIVRNAPIAAGAPLGTSRGIAFDLGVINGAQRLSFAAPGRYSQETLNADAPLKYFVEPVRSALYARVRRDGSERDGRIDYDVAGTLAGNWFAADMPATTDSTLGDEFHGRRQIAFVRNVFRPDRPLVSIGGFDMTGTYAVPVEAPDFAAVTPASRLVVYRLLNVGDGSATSTFPVGTLLVELTDAMHLRVEATRSLDAAASGFSAGAQIYAR
jgi:hypothetical protein